MTKNLFLLFLMSSFSPLFYSPCSYFPLYMLFLFTSISFLYNFFLLSSLCSHLYPRFIPRLVSFKSPHVSPTHPFPRTHFSSFPSPPAEAEGSCLLDVLANRHTRWKGRLQGDFVLNGNHTSPAKVGPEGWDRPERTARKGGKEVEGSKGRERG